MQILILGAGSVGGYFGTHLMERNPDVTFAARGDHANAIAAGGLRFTGVSSNTYAVRLLDATRTAPFDLVVLTTKCVDLERALQDVRTLISPSTTVLTLQNGIDAEEIAEKYVGREQIVAGVAYIDAYIARSAEIAVASPGRLTVGPLPGISRVRAEDVARLFEAAGVSIRLSEQIVPRKWNKLCWNAVFNPFCLLTRQKVGEVRKSPELRVLAEGVIREIRDVGKMYGVQIDVDLSSRIFQAQDGQGSGNADSRTSMWTDFVRGRPTEIDFLNGAISRRGKLHGIPTPVNDTIVALVKSIETSLR